MTGTGGCRYAPEASRSVVQVRRETPSFVSPMSARPNTRAYGAATVSFDVRLTLQGRPDDWFGHGEGACESSANSGGIAQ